MAVLFFVLVILASSPSTLQAARTMPSLSHEQVHAKKEAADTDFSPSVAAIPSSQDRLMALMAPPPAPAATATATAGKSSGVTVAKRWGKIVQGSVPSPGVGH
ncbi:hypothetical protein GUJ93_ZPchr0005g15912 [Zizania palustris]|uniref:Uncharacterized protein n=1 Tax=Zizania palustris TaxID=103762 RepID=A0A8J5W0C8_ZIZPA|nr:hypothetical protein GUJ93_ZPchr0005g15912 [Zizania palustris]